MSVWHKLVCHPETPATSVGGVEAGFGPDALGFRIDGAEALLLPDPAEPTRADGLWQTTCFELFVKPAGGESYIEFNFSPSTRWAAYGFDRYRSGMLRLPVTAPVIEGGDREWRVWLAMDELPRRECRVALSAVIEERDGTKSYWALAHPPGKPDFHHPDCFVLDLPAPERA